MGWVSVTLYWIIQGRRGLYFGEQSLCVVSVDAQLLPCRIRPYLGSMVRGKGGGGQGEGGGGCLAPPRAKAAESAPLPE